MTNPWRLLMARSDKRETEKDAKEKAELKKRMAASLAWSRRLREQQCGRTLGL